VLGLIREGLADQEIADRLEITLAGAKYHVSEILTKLGVESREEAAAWTPPPRERRWWEKAFALSLIWKATSVAVLVATAVGVGVLAWGVARSESDSAEASVFPDLHLPPPDAPPTLTRDELLMGHVIGGGVSAIDIQVSTVEAIYRQFGQDWQHYNGFPLDPADQSTAWLVRTRQWVDTPDQFGSPIGCRGDVIAILDNGPDAFAWMRSGSSPEADAECKGPISRDVAVILAHWAVNLVIPDDEGGQVEARHNSLGDSLGEVRAAGFSPGNVSDEYGSRVWLVTFQGHFYAPGTGAVSPTPAAQTPTVAPPCHTVAVIIDESGTVLFADSAPSDACP
jgi:hypothetical protein